MGTEVPPSASGSVPPSMPAPTTAPCPKCGNPYAQPQSWTWWGGFIGPKILNAVKCLRCGTTFNGKTGQDLTKGIIIYTVVGTVIALALVALCCILAYGLGALSQ